MPLERVVELVGPHRFAGKVVKGFQRGSKQLGWPTANLDPAAFESQLDAATEGVYVGWAAIGDASLPEEARAVHKAILSIGWNPHFDDVKVRTLEAYLTHDFKGRDFYDSPMKLMICAFLRPQGVRCRRSRANGPHVVLTRAMPFDSRVRAAAAKFDSMESLIEAITTDVEFGEQALDTPDLLALRADAFFSE